MKLKIGVVGIGDIAKKAYLPITTRLSHIELYVFTRNQETLKTIKEEYPSITILSTIDELFGIDLDGVMIHSATISHYELCKSFLLKKVPVYVDKPISNNIDEVEELFTIAKEKNVLLRTGFNRRNAPLVQKAKQLGTPNIITYQKNRMCTYNDDISFIYDDFIHVVDTTRYLMDEEQINVTVKALRHQDQLASLHVFLESEHNSSTLIMHRNSGKSEERIELIYPERKVVIEELSSFYSHKNNLTIKEIGNNWETTLHKRGFDTIIKTFINDISNSKSFDTNDLDSLNTHKLCHKILGIIGKNRT